MKKETIKRLVSFATILGFYICICYIYILFKGIFFDVTGEEKAQIREVLMDYEYYNLDEEDLNLISDLDINIKRYEDGSYLVSKDGYTLLYDAANDTYPARDYPPLEYQLKSNLKYFIFGIFIILALWITFIIGKYINVNSDWFDNLDFDEDDENIDEDDN